MTGQQGIDRSVEARRSQCGSWRVTFASKPVATRSRALAAKEPQQIP
jgi:hypothetical protein